MFAPASMMTAFFGERKAEVVFPVHDDLLEDGNVGSPDS